MTILSAIAVLAGAVALHALFATGDEAAERTSPLAPAVPASVPLAGTAGPAPLSSALSPFGRGAPAQEEDPALQRQQRRKKMETLGYATPPDYEQMGVKTLAALVEKGDIYAMLQLGERYYSESDTLAREPGYRTDASPQQIGKQYLEDATLAGHNHVAVILAQKYLDEGKPVDAYAWALLAEKLNDPQASELGRQALGALTPQQRQMADVKFKDLYFRAMQRFAHGYQMGAQR
ncbi:hypothetical protein [Janthinobacterium fluminis]|uniref:Sel1 repeat family protein n=1 Tax=Janthinobacterium fluminis TaxID=2987524 RepID=A0ABT5K3V8_9BURK|nr:hypothetical protein [Janthinobacterium fluminis]MDC8759569.1 hypothetical protein [Janthinobacterium fluminis]